MQLAVYAMGLSVSAFMFCFLKSYKLPPCPNEICEPVSLLTYIKLETYFSSIVAHTCRHQQRICICPFKTVWCASSLTVDIFSLDQSDGRYLLFVSKRSNMLERLIYTLCSRLVTKNSPDFVGCRMHGHRIGGCGLALYGCRDAFSYYYVIVSVFGK